MTRKSNKNNKTKAESFLKKYQLGGDYDMVNPYQFDPDLQTAQQNQIVQLGQPKSQSPYQPVQVNDSLNQVKQGFDALPFLAPAINLGIGVKNIFDSFKERKRQKQYERAYRKDLERRMNDSRVNDYYHTPYEFNWTNNAGSFEEGGSIPERYKNMGFDRVGQKKESDRDGKKWKVLAKKGDQYKVVHGGYEGMEDYTQHKDEQRRENFWNRMGGKDSAKAKDPFSPLYWHKKFGTWQLGGAMDDFLDYYNNKEKQNQVYQQQLQDYYSQKNDFMEQAWRQKQNEGIQGALDGTLGMLENLSGLPIPFQYGGSKQRTGNRTRYVEGQDGKVKIITLPSDTTYSPSSVPVSAHPRLNTPMRDTSGKSKSKDRFREYQEGGTEYNPKTDLYSPEYDPNEFLGIVKNEMSQVEQNDKLESQVESWLFDDEDYDYNDYSVNNEYFSSTNPGDVINKIGKQESGGDYGARNPYSSATGKYQFLKSWAGQIKSFAGYPNSFDADQVMESFRRDPRLQEEFMQHVVNDIYMPEVEKLQPIASRYGLDQDKLIRMIHFRGIGDTRKRLKTGDFSVSQEEKDRFKNPDIMSYLNK